MLQYTSVHSSLFTAICSDTLVLMNGNVSYSPDATPRLEGTVATHSCQNDYKLSGVLNRTCLSNGSWSGVEVLCISTLDTQFNLLYVFLLLFGTVLTVFLTPMDGIPTPGEMYSLTCTASITGSASAPTFQWFHDNSDLTTGQNQRTITNGLNMPEFFNVSTLSFSPLRQSHQGTYTCTVSLDGVSSNSTASISPVGEELFT